VTLEAIEYILAIIRKNSIIRGYRYIRIILEAVKEGYNIFIRIIYYILKANRFFAL
jgi:hypothetical protein